MKLQDTNEKEAWAKMQIWCREGKVEKKRKRKEGDYTIFDNSEEAPAEDGEKDVEGKEKAGKEEGTLKRKHEIKPLPSSTTTMANGVSPTLNSSSLLSSTFPETLSSSDRDSIGGFQVGTNATSGIKTSFETKIRTTIRKITRSNSPPAHRHP